MNMFDKEIKNTKTDNIIRKCVCGYYHCPICYNQMEVMKDGTYEVFIKDELLKKDKEIEKLQNICDGVVERIKKRYPMGAEGCCCEFNDNDEIVKSCGYHQEREDKIEKMKFIIKNMINELPSNKDWFDPEIEKLAREEINSK